MTDILSTISRGKRPQRIFALIYGTSGVGKSFWASNAPKPIFICTEKGTEQLDIARFPIVESFAELIEQLRALQIEKHEFQSIVIDSIDWLEPLLWKAVCDEAQVEHIEQAFGGYGKGYVRALDLWRTLLKELAILNRKMHVLMIGHCMIKSFADPDLANAYDRYQLKINDKAAALVREAADAVLFARFETELVREQGNGRSKARVRGEGVRIMYTESRPAFDAKNRFNLPFSLPLDWKVFGDAIRSFYGLKDSNGNGDGNGHAKPANTEPVAAVPTASESKALTEVRQLLKASRITETEMLDVLRAAQLPEAKTATTLADIPDKTLLLAIESWETVTPLVEELRAQKVAA